jgi:hypothetical protein
MHSGPALFRSEQQRLGDLVWQISTLINVIAKQLMGVCSGAVRRPDHVKKLIDTSSRAGVGATRSCRWTV